jgi:hypothetical protein
MLSDEQKQHLEDSMRRAHALGREQTLELVMSALMTMEPYVPREDTAKEGFWFAITAVKEAAKQAGISIKET